MHERSILGLSQLSYSLGLLYVLDAIEDIVRGRKLRAVKNYRTPKPSANVQTRESLTKRVVMLTLDGGDVEPEAVFFFEEAFFGEAYVFAVLA